MLKKLFLLAALFAGFNAFQVTAAQKQEVIVTVDAQGNTTSTTTTTITKDDSTFGDSLRHFGVAWLCYKGARLTAVVTTLALAAASSRSEQEFVGKFAVLNLLAIIPANYAGYKLTNHFHEQMSDEPYRMAHFLGAVIL